MLARKTAKALALALALLPALLLLALQRVVRPLRLLRLAPLRSERIGHFASNTEVYLCERDAGLHPPAIDLFFCADKVSNPALARMWGRAVGMWPVWLSAVPQVALAIGRRLPNAQDYIAPILENRGRDIEGLLASTPPHLAFTEVEEAEGQRGLRALGVPEGAEFVCFHVRDPAYLSAEFSAVDWGYMSHRDATLESHVPAAEALAELGYWVIRMGSVVASPLPATHPRVIDYPLSGLRSDLMDLYLGAKCRFYFGTDSGIWAVSGIFRRPIVFSSYSMIGAFQTWGWNYIHVPALLRRAADGSLVPFAEIAERRLAILDTNERLEQEGVVLVHSAPEVIVDAVLEMDARLKGEWVETPEDAAMQRRCWELLSPVVEHPERGGISTRVAAGLLKRHPELLA